YRVASLARAGAHVAFGSDSPVADPDPLLGVYGAVTRLYLQGAEVGLHEAVSVADALRFAITGSAYTAQREAELGMLAPGMLADMVVLDQDPLEVASEDIRRIRPEATIIGGQVVWES
ncbi:MAG: amidohydrolase family protein, partial [SAR202 cluster bacterium]|nr:amidohydrolase family protein [SAR202 cluster bacterium]